MSICRASPNADPRVFAAPLHHWWSGTAPSVLWCLKSDRPPNKDDAAPDDQSDDWVHEDDAFLCVSCELDVAERDAVFDPGAGPLQLHVNPHGHLHEILTLSAARNLAYYGEETTEFTWFPGYAWRVALCGRCHSHLGWRFAAVEESRTPATFYGLLRKAIY